MLIQEYGIQYHQSSTYKLQTNGAVEAANKNIKRILRKMVEISRMVNEAPFRIVGLSYIFFVPLLDLPYILWCMVWNQYYLLRLRWDL